MAFIKQCIAWISPSNSINIKRCEEMTGGGKDASSLASKMSGAWINFARSGNPNTPNLPKWPAYTAENGAVMMFDVQSVVSKSSRCRVVKNSQSNKLIFSRHLPLSEPSKTGVATVLLQAISLARSFLSGQKHILQLFFAD